MIILVVMESRGSVHYAGRFGWDHLDTRNRLGTITVVMY